MANFELVMPKLGESIMEATILKWVKQVGDRIEMDEAVLEIATDKVDSEVPSPVSGVLLEIKYPENAVVAIGQVIAVIGSEAGGEVAAAASDNGVAAAAPANPAVAAAPAKAAEPAAVAAEAKPASDRFYSPLVRSMAKNEGISLAELDAVPGSGEGGRLNKSDMLAYIERRKQGATAPQAAPAAAPKTSTASGVSTPIVDMPSKPAVSMGGDVEIIEMDRMRRLIADHMVMSKHTSPHVTSFVEADVTNMVNWRNSVKDEFKKKYGENITFTPLFIEAIVRAIRDYPMINVSVDGTNIIKKNNINIGMAAALPTGNLIVPVIKKADHLSLLGLTKAVNDLAGRARKGQLKPDEIQDGTFTLTNVGTFGNVMGTPIINQPQVAIMAAGAVRKRPAVLETPYGDVIAIRHMMFLSLSYDHRVVDGMLGGSFLRRVADYMEGFDPNRAI